MDSIDEWAKEAVRQTVGLWPALELRNRILLAPALPKLVRFENTEVGRLSQQLGSIPSARVACVIPTYRRPDGVVAAIESILDQTRQDFVIIVIDDGAGLPALPSDPRVFGVSLSRNAAIAGLVRNVGVRLTRSDYIAFLDDDNTWMPQHLELAIGSLESESADVVYTALRRLRPDGTEFDVLSRAFDRRALANEKSWVDTNSIVLRRSAWVPFSRLPRSRTTFPREDWEFVWRLSSKARVHHLPIATVEYLMNPDSFFTTWSPEL